MRKLWLLALTAALVAATVGFAKGGGTIAMVGEFREPALGADSDRIDGDGGGAYVSGESGVRAILQNEQHRSDFILDLSLTKGTRTLFLDFSDCVPPGTCGTPPFLQGNVYGATVMQTRAANLPSLPIGRPTRQRLHLGFRAPDPAQGFKTVSWFLMFDPEDTTTSCRSSLVWVTRTQTMAVPAVDVWVIEADSADEGCLRVQFGKGWQNRGKFHMPFQLTVKKK